MLLLGLYALIVSSMVFFLHSQNNLVGSLFATAIIAIVFQPARARLQTLINRWLFGERDDPEGVLTRLTTHLEAADSGSSLLTNLVETIAVSLKLPYVALRLREADGTLGTAIQSSAIQSSAIQNAQKPDHVETLPLMHQQTRIGQLEVAPRSPGETLSTADQQLLAAIARLAATSIRTIQLSNEVQEARTRIVAAREEERRRLRRDLHDGLGPVLAALTLQSETARDLVRLDPTEAESLMTAVADQAEAATHEIRRLVYDLRPPALDALGLLAALRSHAANYATSSVHFHFDLPDVLPPLPAAVEVALYRIVGEAINNVLHHAQAHHCWVTLQQQEHTEQPSVAMLTLTIVDDGKGLSTAHQAGVGILSMRERCVELGGMLQLQAAGSEPLPGLRIIAQLPLPNGIDRGR